MRPENRGLLLAWINAVLEHAKELPDDERDDFVHGEFRKLEEDFSVVMLWENNKVVLSFTL